MTTVGDPVPKTVASNWCRLTETITVPPAMLHLPRTIAA
jgi:hypothetical protein